MDIRIRRQDAQKKYPHNLTHQVSTTSGFGFLQPILVKECSAEETVNLRVGQKVYLQPLVKPTFGQCELRTYSYFVPMADIWNPWESFLSGQSYRGSEAHYIPLNVPSFMNRDLTCLLRLCSEVWVFTAGCSEIQNGLEISKQSDDKYHTSSFTDALQQSFLTLNSFGNGMQTYNFPTSFHMTSESLDSLDGFDWFLSYKPGANVIVFAGRFNKVGSDLRKIFLGCGFQMNSQTKELNMLPIFAYFKAYFDMFYPARDMTWKDTKAFGFLERCEQHGYGLSNTWNGDSTCVQLFLSFIFDELVQCYYTQNPDFVSAHITGTSLPVASPTSLFPYVAPNNSVGHSVHDDRGQTPRIAQTESVDLGWPAIDILRRLTFRKNIHTAIGGRIDKFLRSIFGSDTRNEPESFYLGSQILDIDISAVMNQAQTTEGFLGQYAARGVGQHTGIDLHYECRSAGYLITMMAVVPFARYSQAVDPTLSHITKYDFFNPDLDSVTLKPTPKYEVYGIQEVEKSGQQSYTDLQSGFGNIPLYMEYKQHYNILNGDMSKRSTRSSYLPFTLDKLLPYSSTQNGRVVNLSPDILVNGSIWRYIGKDAWLGNYDRIFVNDGDVNTPDDDNFIIFNYVDLKSLSFALPTADSFQTGSLTEDSFKVQKA